MNLERVNGNLDSLLAAGGLSWFPPPSSTTAASVDQLFYFILFVCIAFFALIGGVMAVLVLSFRRREARRVQRSPDHNNWLELAWSVIPTILVAIIFMWGFIGYLDARTPPDDAYEVQVVARKWSWAFIYPNGHVDSDLHVPADRPIALVMSSDDVIHSLFVPAFRLKMDLVPGRYSKAWFEATEAGKFDLYCAEYCGTGHSLMNASVVVHASGEFQKWLDDAGNYLDELTPVEAGGLLYTRRGCVQCHSLDGSAKAGPSFRGVFGTSQRMASGEDVEIDENYIRESILEPQAKLRAGFRPVMPTYKGQLTDEEISALVQFIKSLE